MEFRLLGPLEVIRRGQRFEPTANKPRAFLAMLLLEPGRTVSQQRLLGELWEDEPPRSALVNLRTYAAQLRQGVFGGEEGRLLAGPGGYRVVLNGDSVDTDEFERHCQEARQAHLGGLPHVALELYERARALRRGAPLADVQGGPALSAASVALDERYDTITETCLELRLELARSRDEYGQLIADLRRYIAERPLRELPWRLMILTLYRFGDIAAALGAYRSARATFLDALGMEPGPELRALHQAVLRRELANGSGGTGDVLPRQLVRSVDDGTRGRGVHVTVCSPQGGTDLEHRVVAELRRLMTARGAVVYETDDVELTRSCATRAGAGGRVGSGSGLRRTDALVVVGGSWEALSVIAAAKRCHNVPVVQLEGWTVLDGSGSPVPGIQKAGSPREAVQYILDD